MWTHLLIIWFWNCYTVGWILCPWLCKWTLAKLKLLLSGAATHQRCQSIFVLRNSWICVLFLFVIHGDLRDDFGICAGRCKPRAFATSGTYTFAMKCATFHWTCHWFRNILQALYYIEYVDHIRIQKHPRDCSATVPERECLEPAFLVL
jgi:hypothetical protein